MKCAYMVFILNRLVRAPRPVLSPSSADLLDRVPADLLDRVLRRPQPRRVSAALEQGQPEVSARKLEHPPNGARTCGALTAFHGCEPILTRF